MGLSSYLPVLRTLGVMRLVFAQLVARLPAGMTAIAVLLQVQWSTGSFGTAGLAVAVLSLGQAAAGPLGGRAIGRWGARRVILVCAGSSGAFLLALALLPLVLPALPVPALLVLAGGAGLFTPPVQPTARTMYQRLVDHERLVPLLSLDASLQELIFVVAPVLITVVSGQIGPAVGVVAVAAVLLGGCLWFALSPEVDRVEIPRPARRMGAVVTRPAVLVGVLVGLVLVGASSAVEVGVVAAFVDGKLVAGALLALYSLSSLVGGILVGVVRTRPWSLTRRLVVVAAGLAVCAVWPNIWGLVAGLFLAGLGVAPALAVTYVLVSRTVAFDDTPEAFGWLGTGVLVGAAVGAAGAGYAIDFGGVEAAFAFAALLAAAGVVIAAASVPVLPRNLGDAAPAGT